MTHKPRLHLALFTVATLFPTFAHARNDELPCGCYLHDSNVPSHEVEQSQLDTAVNLFLLDEEQGWFDFDTGETGTRYRILLWEDGVLSISYVYRKGSHLHAGKQRLDDNVRKGLTLTIELQ